MTKAYSLTKRLLAGVVVLFGVLTASNAGAETPPATEWTYDATAKTISSGGWTFAVSTGVTKTGADGTKTTGVSLAMTKTRNTGTADALNFRTAQAALDAPIVALENLFGGASGVNITAIKKVWLPDSVVSMNGTFRNCTALQVMSAETAVLPPNLASMGDRTFQSCSALAFGEIALGTNGTFSFSGTYQFQSCSGITRIILGEGVASLPESVFSYCTNVKEVEFLGYTTWNTAAFGGGTSAAQWNDLQARFVIPFNNASWDKFLNDNKGIGATTMNNVSDWNEATMGDAYRTKFGADAKSPTYLINTANTKTKRQYVVIKAGEIATRTLNVTAEPKELAPDETVPAYGNHPDVSADLPLTCSAPQFVPDGDIYYECVKYRLETQDPSSGAYVDQREADGHSFEYNPSAAGIERLAWLFAPVGYRPNVKYAEAGGTVSYDPLPTLGDGQFYPSNTTVQITATPVAGRKFVRWYGDVDESVCSNRTVSVTLTGVKTLIAYFDTPWVVADGNKSMSDGYWTIPISGYPDAMTLGSAVYPDAKMPMELDLGKEIVGGGTITALADFFVGFQNDNNYRLRRVVLPRTLGSIGYSAFRRCAGLKCVEPFLPESVYYFGAYSFANCSSLKMSCLTLTGTKERGLSVPIEPTSSQYNQLNGVTVTNVVFGEYVTAYPMSAGAMPSGVMEVRYLGASVNISNTGLNQYARIYFAHKPTYADGNFSKWTAYGSRIYVAKNDETWMTYVNDAANVTKWADLGETVQGKFKPAAGERHPFGLFVDTAFAPSQWVFLWNPKPSGMKLIFR